MRPYYIAIVGSGPSAFFAAASREEPPATELLDMAVDMRRCCRPWGGWCARGSRRITPRSSRSASNSKDGRGPPLPRWQT